MKQNELSFVNFRVNFKGQKHLMYLKKRYCDGGPEDKILSFKFRPFWNKLLNKKVTKN